MEENFRKELNEQTLAIIKQLLEDSGGVVIACMIRDKDGKQLNVMGYEIGPMEFMPIVKEALETLLDAYDKMKKDTPKN